MSSSTETFFTSVGCMDGRVQKKVVEFGKQKFKAEYPDTITEAGLVGLLARDVSDLLLQSLKKKISISSKLHHSKGIIIHGHQECAGNQVSDKEQKEDIKKSVEVIKSLIDPSLPVVGVFVKRSPNTPSKWIVEEL